MGKFEEKLERSTDQLGEAGHRQTVALHKGGMLEPPKLSSRHQTLLGTLTPPFSLPQQSFWWSQDVIGNALSSVGTWKLIRAAAKYRDSQITCSSVQQI